MNEQNPPNPNNPKNIEINFNCQDGKPLQLVKITPEGNFEIIKETVNYLKTIEGGVAICSIVGKYRTGKSFLINKILDLQGNNGFIVSPSVNACTKGLWIWSTPIYNDRENLNIFFMDTEGLDSVEQNDNIDHKLFTLSVLLSSYFIYNSLGAIEENSISSLGLITKLIKSVTVDEGVEIQNSYSLSQYAPKFLWILRDFVLEVKDLRGKNVSPKLYLESVLSDIPVGETGYTRNSENGIAVRETILNFFKNRDCITLVRPVDDEEDLRNIQFLNDNKIKKGFLDKLNVIRDKIYRECIQKTINGTPLNMSMFLKFLSQFVNSFNNGKIPSIQTAWKNLLENECNEISNKALELYNLEINQYYKENKNYDKLGLFKYLNQLRDYTLNYFSKCFYIKERDPDTYNKYFNNLKTFLDEDQVKTINFFYEKADEQNSEILGNLFIGCNFEKFENFSSKKIVRVLKKNIIRKYLEENVGGEESITFEKNIEYYSKGLFDNYVTFLENNKMKKKREYGRKLEIEKEKLKFDMANMENKEELLKRIKVDIDNLEDKNQNFHEIDDKAFEELKAKNQGLKNIVKGLSEEIKINGNKLTALEVENQKKSAKKKKKKFFGLC